MKLFLLQGEHEKLLRLLRKLRRDIALPRRGDPAGAQRAIDRIDRFFQWRKRILNRSTVGYMRKHWKPAPPVVAKAMRRAVEAFHSSSEK